MVTRLYREKVVINSLIHTKTMNPEDEEMAHSPEHEEMDEEYEPYDIPVCINFNIKEFL